MITQPTKSLKELGSKARARLEEEKSKRPEVRLLEQVPTKDPQQKQKAGCRSASTFSAKVASRKSTQSSRKRKASTAKYSKPTKTAPADRSNVSAWVPDVSHIGLPEPKERSSTVKLHGLPLDCTIEHVNKFFAGLQPARLSILLSNETQITLLDCSNSPPPMVSRQGLATGEIKRIRVLAHFSSPAAAVLASERSGESMRISTETGNDKVFVIAVTVLSRCLEKALSYVSLSPVSHTPFHSMLESISQRLHPITSSFLWTYMTRRMFQGLLPLDRNMQKLQLMISSDDEKTLLLRENDDFNRNFWAIYQRCAEAYNRLVDIQDELLHQLPYPMVELGREDDKSTLSAIQTGHADPAVHLTTLACEILNKELDCVEGLLYRARLSHRMSS